MTEWIITSCILILVVVLLRTVLKGRISLRLQYALWALVLVRLLVPGSLFSSSISVMNAVEKPSAPAEITIADPPGRWEYPGIELAPSVTETVDGQGNPTFEEDLDKWGQDQEDAWQEYKGEHTEYVTLPVADILRVVWYIGMAAMALWLVIGNLRFYLRLTRSREIMKYAPPSVYVAKGIETPCLFGLFRPAVYVTPEVAEDKAALAHVLAHEETHYRHKDHIWAVLRCACLVLHWYNPLVWLAAALSRRDSELACDEGAIRRLGEEQRAAYGRTLIGLTCAGRSGLLRTATTMTGSKKSIKERIVLIARKPKMKLYTLTAVILIAVIAVGCTFTGQSMDFPAWVSTITLEDLDDLVMGPEDSKVQLKSPAGSNIVYLDQESKEELLTILQEIRPGDFRTEPPDGGGTEGTYCLSFISEKHENSEKPDRWWDFTCIGNGQLKVSCCYDQFKSRYGFRDVQYLDCPELSKFIIAHSGPYRTEGEPVYTEQLEEDYAQQMMAEHAAELTAQLGREVYVGNVFGTELWRAEAATGPNYRVDAYKADYFLLHDVQGDSEEPVYGGIVRYDRYMFLLYTGDQVILLGHMDDTTLANVYGTPEMIGRYGDMYAAAAGALYEAYGVEQGIMPIDPERTDLPEAPTAALEEMISAGELTIALRSETLGERTAYDLSSGQPKRIMEVLDGYGWTVVDETPAMTGDILYLSSEDGGRLTMAGDYVRYQLGDVDIRWKAASLSKEDYTVMENVRRSFYDHREYYNNLIAPFAADGPRAAAARFAELYGQRIMNATPGSIYRVRDYDVYDMGVMQVSTDKRAISAYILYYVLPDGDHNASVAAGDQSGTGEYEGWIRKHFDFLLEQRSDGLWYCRDYNDVQKLYKYGYTNGLWGAIYGNPQSYRCEETDPQRAAEKLIAAYVADLMIPDELRSFTVTDYRNLAVEIVHTPEMSEVSRSEYHYGLSEAEVGEDIWIVEFTMEYRWTGILHNPPAGSGDSMPEDMWFDQTWQGSPLGFLMIREGDEFVLRSRWETRY